ncbi:hypothetical protein F5148DRAFT_1294860 [Russula earlei]|uniref:Uncharacterized protein n=1 Tax=Russula earlei TaxID=71964 RepID=A0ACC0TSZ9_9AGAM|nr:hypothetical protein F5148DRAFT_1294860 [Russula earlei]
MTQQLLSKEQEGALVSWVGHQALIAKPMDQNNVKSLRYNMSGIIPGKNWHRCFQKQHPELWSSKPSNLDPKHAQNFNISNLFSPFLRNNSETYYPPNHDSLASILGLAHAYLKHLHPSKLAQPDESMKASAHLLKLFLNDTLVTALPLGHHPQSTALTRELNLLQNHLTSLETTLINLTQASVDVRKEIKALPKNTTTPAKAKVPLTPASNTTPTYAAKASLHPHPSVVMKTSAYTWPASLCPNPVDICTTINSALHSTNNNQVHMSAARWTQKGNLVIWGGLNTMAHNLMTSLPAISEALQASLSVNSISAPQEPPPV